MTNREFIESLTDEGFAEFLGCPSDILKEHYGITRHVGCNGGTNCNACVTDWLGKPSYFPEEEES